MFEDVHGHNREYLSTKVHQLHLSSDWLLKCQLVSHSVARQLSVDLLQVL
jgi:hypothetical protein